MTPRLFIGGILAVGTEAVPPVPVASVPEFAYVKVVRLGTEVIVYVPSREPTELPAITTV
jgi:hypothetical protein